MNPKSAASRHGLIFLLLAVLALASVALHHLQLPAGQQNFAIFAIAFLMAGLVVLRYMGLKGDGPLAWWIFIIPLVLFAILVVALLPDVAHQPVPKVF